MLDVSFSEILGNVLKSSLQILAPTLIVMGIVALIYVLFCMLKTKMLEGSEKKWWQIFIGSVSKTFTLIIEKFPSLLIVAVLITCVSVFSNFGNEFYNIWAKQKKIKELTLYAKNLGNNDEIARVTLLEKHKAYNEEYGVYLLEVIDGITGNVVSSREIRLDGKDFRLDALVVNFEYSEIGEGKQKNLAFPYRVFSEKIAPENAIIIENLITTDSTSYFLEDESSAVLGIPLDDFKKRAEEFIQIIKNPVQSQEMGIRSSYGNTITLPANAAEGDVYSIRIEGTGGLTLRKAYSGEKVGSSK